MRERFIAIIIFGAAKKDRGNTWESPRLGTKVTSYMHAVTAELKCPQRMKNRSWSS